MRVNGFYSIPIDTAGCLTLPGFRFKGKVSVVYNHVLLRVTRGTVFVQAGQCAYVLVGMALLWVTEAVPIPVTALVPVVLFPALGILTASEVASSYMGVSVCVCVCVCVCAGGGGGVQRLYLPKQRGTSGAHVLIL